MLLAQYGGTQMGSTPISLLVVVGISRIQLIDLSLDDRLERSLVQTHALRLAEAKSPNAGLSGFWVLLAPMELPMVDGSFVPA
jgi:hypothetical protein